MVEKVKIRLMGGFGIVIDGVVLSDATWRSRRAADLVKLLALAPRHRLTREQIIDALWPDLDPDAGATNVRKAAYRARRVTGDDDIVTLDGGIVALAPGRRIETDVEVFEAEYAEASRVGSVTAYREAARYYGGELLPDDRYAPWCGLERDQLRRRYLETLAGGELWGRLVDEEPTNERAHQEIIRAHLASGDRAAAIRQFEQLRTCLRDELGVSPDPTSVQLYEMVLAMEGPDTPTPAERARALLAWAVVHWERSDLEEAKRTALTVKALAIDAGLGRELADASELLGLVAYAQGEWKRVFSNEFLEMVRGTPDLAPFVLDAHMCMSEFAIWEEEGVADMRRFADEILTETAQFESPQGRAMGLLVRAESQLLSGVADDDTRAELEEASRLWEQAGCLTGQALAEERVAQLLMTGPDREVGMLRHRHALELARDAATFGHLLLFIHGGMLKGLDPDDELALKLIEAAEEERTGVDVCDPCSMGYLVRAAIATATAGDIEAADGHLAEAERVAAMWSSGPWHAAVDEARAAFQLAKGESTEGAVSLLERATDGFATAHRPGDAERCRRKLATIT